LYPGNVFSVKNTPNFIEPIKLMLNRRGDGSSGWSRAWKTALWARLRDGDHANLILKGYFKEQAFPQLFAKGGNVMQIDATMGVTAAISEMLVQSNNGVIDLLPALPHDWTDGEFKGVCTTGAFEVDLKWKANKLFLAKILSRQGNLCRVTAVGKFTVTQNGKKIKAVVMKDASVQFATVKDGVYELRGAGK